MDDLLREIGPFVVISGGAKGADSLAADWAREHGQALQVYPADWATYGRSAGPIRNREIVEHADRLIAFWDGISPGTRSVVRLAARKGIHLTICVIGPTLRADGSLS